MISLLQAAQFCKAIYRPVTPDVFDSTYSIDSVEAGYKLLGDTNVFAFAGSQDIVDWMRDFEALPVRVPAFGNSTVHRGMLQGVASAFGMMKALASNGKKNAVVGHSLGGAHAAYFAAYCIAAGLRVDFLVGLESPKPGFADFAAFVQKGLTQPAIVTKNGEDPVPDVPLTLPDFPFTHVAPLTMLNEPAPFDCIDPFPDHAIARVIEGVEKLRVI